MAKSTWFKGLAVAAAVGVLVAGGLYLYGSASGAVPATVDFSKLDAPQSEALYRQQRLDLSCRRLLGLPQLAANRCRAGWRRGHGDPMGTLYGSNISPSKEHGISRWTADDLYRAVAAGIAPGRKVLYPAMPYASYHQITRGDVDALWVWLMKQRPVEVANRANEMSFPFSITPALPCGTWSIARQPRSLITPSTKWRAASTAGGYAGPLCRASPQPSHQAHLCDGQVAQPGRQHHRRLLRTCADA